MLGKGLFKWLFTSLRKGWLTPLELLKKLINTLKMDVLECIKYDLHEFVTMVAEILRYDS